MASPQPRRTAAAAPGDPIRVGSAGKDLEPRPAAVFQQAGVHLGTTHTHMLQRGMVVRKDCDSNLLPAHMQGTEGRQHAPVSLPATRTGKARTRLWAAALPLAREETCVQARGGVGWRWSATKPHAAGIGMHLCAAGVCTTNPLRVCPASGLRRPALQAARPAHAGCSQMVALVRQHKAPPAAAAPAAR